MPVAIPALLTALISTGVGVGATALEGGFSGPSGPSTAELEQQQKQQAQADADKQAKADAAMKAAALRRSAPEAQAQTGGSLTDAPFASLVSSISGQPGNIQEALRALGLGNPESPGASQQPELAFSGGS